LVETLSALPEPSHDISILIGADIPIGKVHEMLSTVPLPKPFRVGLAGEKGTNIVFLETIARFKGLESNCVFLLFGNESSNLNQEVYVGGTRATHELHMVMINESKVINE
jgi:hypothetical protein